MAVPHKQLTVVIGIIERDGRFLAIRRVDEIPEWHHKWELPGGKIDVDESPIDALRREAFEETGLQIQDPQLLGVHTHHWRMPEFTQQTFLIVYRAQAEAGEVTLQLEECDAHRWVTLEEYLAMPDNLDGNREMIASLYAAVRKDL